VLDHAQHDGTERSKLKCVAATQDGRVRPVFGRRAKVTGAEHDGRKACHAFRRQRIPRREPQFDGAACRQMNAEQACRQRRCVVRNDDIALADKIRKGRPRMMRHGAVLIDDEQLRIGGALNRNARVHH